MQDNLSCDDSDFVCFFSPDLNLMCADEDGQAIGYWPVRSTLIQITTDNFKVFAIFIDALVCWCPFGAEWSLFFFFYAK